MGARTTHMNAFNKRELEQDTEGLLESCDFCNALIINWEILNNCIVTFEGKIKCKNCVKIKEELE